MFEVETSVEDDDEVGWRRGRDEGRSKYVIFLVIRYLGRQSLGVRVRVFLSPLYGTSTMEWCDKRFMSLCRRQ